jgi:pimeloyl-ACP methyl ester carboxylesterase/membrane protein DedA with SNARE-associated domain
LSVRRRRSGRKIALLGLYVLLLLVSHAVRAVRDPRPALGPGVSVAAVRAVRGGDLLDRTVELAYLDTGSAAHPEAAPALLLHGSPGSRAGLRDLVRGLAGRRLIVPDLPGFGESTREIPDYSNRAHARYLLQLLDHLDLERVHVVGFSMGGGAGLELYGFAPERVRSMTLLSSIGVQELELFGDHGLNHSVHAVQLALLWLAREGVPHMGLLDDVLVGVPYARNFFDTDQRPLRSILLGFQPPMLIVHGTRDFLVPPEAARESHRLVPQSRIEWIDGSHFMVFEDGLALARPIGEFLHRVDRDLEPDRHSAPPDRVAASRAPFDFAMVPPFTGVALLVMMALIALATLVSEDLTCIAVGLLVAQGRIGFLPGVVACATGIFVGDLLLYLAGRVLGRTALRRRPLRWLVRPAQLEQAASWFARRGPVIIGLSRFTPGTRIPVYVAAGLLRSNFWSFSFYFLLAVALWTPFLVGISMVAGEQMMGWFQSFQRFALPALLLLGLWILVVIKVGLPLLQARGRRELAGRWCRLTRWEFWPPWAFYPPVLAHVLRLGWKHRSPLLFTAANPAIPAGGFVAESKWRILEGLSGAGDRVARGELLPAGIALEERTARVREFLRRHDLDYPVILKPDAGQRGSGVAVVRDGERLAAYLERAPFATLVQEYVPGEEFGIFYYRYPDEPRGRIFSITEKRLPVLRGDGRHTLEELILLDRRAVCVLRHYLRVNAGRLGWVPREGEAVRLVELGTHCRGAIFLDGSGVWTERLERVIDGISRSYDGFFFGRYDVRCPDADTLMAGRGFKVIELNGVTSEATHIYDPRLGLREAYRTLFEQWAIAFEIGRRNRLRGADPVGPAELLRLLGRYWKLSRAHPS